MLIGVALAPYHRGAGAAVFVTGLILTLLLGGWLTGGWILQDLTLAQWHPGYLLPTVAGGLIAAAGSASLGFNSLANADARLRHAVTCALLAVITLAIGLLGLMTIRGLVERSYLPRPR